VRIGGDEVIVMAGPCSAETDEQVNATRPAVKRAGGKFLRGGAFKPRSSPYSFRAMARKAAHAARRRRSARPEADLRGDGRQPDRS
jgi:3-deoxy-7-phosphoheptulonate synthase